MADDPRRALASLTRAEASAPASTGALRFVWWRIETEGITAISTAPGRSALGAVDIQCDSPPAPVFNNRIKNAAAFARWLRRLRVKRASL